MFSVGFQSIPWILNSEIYPIHLAGTGQGLAAAVSWIFSFIVCSLFLHIIESDVGKPLIFVIFFAFTLMLYFFVYKLLPETAGQKIKDNVKNIIGEEEDELAEFENSINSPNISQQVKE